MQAALALVAALVQVLPPPVLLPAPARPGQPIAWETLPPLPYRNPPALSPAIVAFVTGEVESGRCRPNLTGPGKRAMQVDIAVLVTPEHGARVTIPRAIDCPTVEQYAAGLVLSFARNNLSARTTLATAWYRATMTFEWRD